jgi:hypothetical protein
VRNDPALAPDVHSLSPAARQAALEAPLRVGGIRVIMTMRRRFPGFPDEQTRRSRAAFRHSGGLCDAGSTTAGPLLTGLIREHADHAIEHCDDEISTMPVLFGRLGSIEAAERTRRPVQKDLIKCRSKTKVHRGWMSCSRS